MEHRFHTAAVCLALVMGVAGCAAPARVEQMTAAPSAASAGVPAGSPLRNNIAIKDVTGGQETNPMWVSNVGSAEFDRALEASLRGAGLLAASRQAGRYQLTAHLQKLDQPMFGASMTVTATVSYTLTERSGGKVVFERTLATPFTASWNSAFIGSERLKLANEGAIRTNIQQLIESLAALQVASLAPSVASAT